MIRTPPAETSQRNALSSTTSRSSGSRRSRAEAIGTRDLMVTSRFCRKSVGVMPCCGLSWPAGMIVHHHRPTATRTGVQPCGKPFARFEQLAALRVRGEVDGGPVVSRSGFDRRTEPATAEGVLVLDLFRRFVVMPPEKTALRCDALPRAEVRQKKRVGFAHRPRHGVPRDGLGPRRRPGAGNQGERNQQRDKSSHIGGSSVGSTAFSATTKPSEIPPENRFTTFCGPAESGDESPHSKCSLV